MTVACPGCTRASMFLEANKLEWPDTQVKGLAPATGTCCCSSHEAVCSSATMHTGTLGTIRIDAEAISAHQLVLAQPRYYALQAAGGATPPEGGTDSTPAPGSDTMLTDRQGNPVPQLQLSIYYSKVGFLCLAAPRQLSVAGRRGASHAILMYSGPAWPGSCPCSTTQ
jgi:hypothetical protein